MKKMIRRSEQKPENTWNLESIYSNRDSLKADIEKVQTNTQELESYKGKILASSENLVSVLDISFETERIIEKLFTYTFRRYDEDLTNDETNQMKGEITNLYTNYLKKTSFIVPELLHQNEDIIEKYLKENKDLEKYKLWLKRMFDKKKYVLSEQEERVISAFSNALNTPENIAGILRNAEIKFYTIKDENGTEVEINNETYQTYIMSNDRRVRQDTFEALYHAYQDHKQSLAEALQGNVSKIVVENKLRGYSNSKEASLIQNRVTPIVYDKLIQEVHKHIDVLYDYFKLKKEVLKLDDFCLYDAGVNLAQDTNHEYSYEEAKKIVFDVISVFGKEYQEVVKEAFQDRWIDIYPNKGKRGGAYSAGSYDTKPFILLNFQGKYHDVSTLAHELGHSMHSYYSNHNNPYIYSNYKIFVAEVASTVNEMLLNYYMLEHSKDKNEKKFILSEMMDLFKATIFRQTMFSEFEEFMYDSVEQGKTLTSDILSEKYYQLNEFYFGKDVVINDEIRYEWARVPHFYYNFYVYQYATGLIAACYIVNRILSHEENAVTDYLNFLKTGDSMDPIEELKVAGVDMTSEEVFTKAMEMFSDLIASYRKLDQ